MFRFILLVGMAVVSPIALYYRVRALSGGERADRQQERPLSRSLLRPLGAAWIAAIVVYVAKPEWLSSSACPLPIWSRWLGAVLWVLSLALLVWTYQALGRNLTDTVAPRGNATLVTSGPYRFVRHPMYSSFLGIAAGLALLTANWLIGAGGMLVWLLMATRTSREEAALIDRFGEDYRTYCRRTGRFLPRLTSAVNHDA